MQQLYGAWAIEPDRFHALIARAKAADLNALRAQFQEPGSPDLTVSDGIATIELSGSLMKRPSFFLALFGGASTQQAAAALRAALGDPQVRAILLRVDSPGGTVAGTQELADAVRDADEQKPVFAYIEDLGASAAYWIASQARRVFTNKAGAVGGIGTFAVVEDTSGMAEQAGIKVHVVTSGGAKGIGVRGAPVTEEDLVEVQRMVDSYADLFVRAVARGRGITLAQARALADGRLHFGDQAKQAGLVDAVGSLQDARRQLVRQTMSKKTIAFDELSEDVQAHIRSLEAEKTELVAAKTELVAKIQALEKPPGDPMASLPPEARAMVEKAQADAEEAKTRVGQIEAEARATKFKARAKGIGQPEAFGAVLATASTALSEEHYQQLEQVLRAQHEQIREGKLFGEVGTTEGADGATATATERARARAQQLVAEGKAADENAALSQVFRTDPRLHREYQRESEVRV